MQGSRLTAWEMRARRHPAPARRRRGGGVAHGSAARSTWSSPAPTASPPTATPRTRSAPTRWPSWRATTAFPSTWPRRVHRRSRAAGVGAADPDRGARPADEVRRVGGRPTAPEGSPVLQPGLRRHARGADHRHRHRARRVSPPVRLLGLSTASTGSRSLAPPSPAWSTVCSSVQTSIHRACEDGDSERSATEDARAPQGGPLITYRGRAHRAERDLARSRNSAASRVLRLVDALLGATVQGDGAEPPTLNMGR